MTWLALLVACRGTTPAVNPDAAALDQLGPPVATGDLTLTSETPDGAVLEVYYYDTPVAQTPANETRTFVWPLALDSWGAVVLIVDDRVYEGIDGDALLEVTSGNPPVVDVFLQGAVLLGDDGAVAIPTLSWEAVPVE